MPLLHYVSQKKLLDVNWRLKTDFSRPEPNPSFDINNSEAPVKRLIFCVVIAAVLLSACFSYAAIQIRTEKIMFSNSIGNKKYRQEAMLYVPLDGKEQHPLILTTHGRHGAFPERNERQVYALKELNQALANRGFFVMMLVRRGYGNSEGPDSEFLETAEESGLAGAEDVKGAIEYMCTRQDILKDRIVITGISQGGLVSLAASSLDIKGVLGTVNISGAVNFRQGVGKPIRDPRVEDYLRKSAKVYGRLSRVPTLWLYAQNDNHLPATLEKWFNTYREAGGKGKLRLVQAFSLNRNIWSHQHDCSSPEVSSV